MTLETIVVMVLVLGTVWGGFGFCLYIAMRNVSSIDELAED